MTYQEVCKLSHLDDNDLIGELNKYKPQLINQVQEYKKVNHLFKIQNRLLHSFNEYNRVLDLIKHIDKNDDESKLMIKKILNDGHDSLNILFEVSNDELNKLQSLVRDVSLGCRIVGAGFGGSLICIVDNICINNTLNKLRE